MRFVILLALFALPACGSDSGSGSSKTKVEVTDVTVDKIDCPALLPICSFTLSATLNDADAAASGKYAIRVRTNFAKIGEEVEEPADCITEDDSGISKTLTTTVGFPMGNDFSQRMCVYEIDGDYVSEGLVKEYTVPLVTP